MASENLDDYGFDIGLIEMGDEGNSFRTQNDPSAPFQRRNIVERKGIIDIRCIAKDVVHGYMNNGDEPATLLVYDFQFDPREAGRRILSADIELFYSSTDGRQPEVVDIAPKGRNILAQTTQSETISTSTNLSAGADLAGAQLGGEQKWEKAINRERTDATRVIGSIDLKNRTWGESNTASWTLLENESVKTGVPAHLLVAVLLKRPDEDMEFQCACKIRSSVDLVSRLVRLFGSKPKDDPILYNPTLPSTSILRPYDLSNLGQIELQELSRVEFTNTDT
ncbi:hypothetical protein PG999_001452 [Apiospora kogelbergensis]|uniref:Uncharacterized protein n=1 Tax=Apiospora kogelbergensis TaxID=1337665 RepID=A0AAW0REX9_9PEZI